MLGVSFFQTKYLSSAPKKGRFIEEIDSTKKWAEHSINIWEMNNLLREELTFDEKVVLRRAIEVAERKKNWHYLRDNFDLRVASILVEAVKRASLL